MPTPLRIVTFNVENLFSRAKLLNFLNNAAADKLIVQVGELQKELAKTAYDKATILALYAKLKDYVEIVEIRNKLFDRSKKKIKANGVSDWDGFISFKREKFGKLTRENTARVIREVNADICCLIEVEDRKTLKHFAADLLKKGPNFVPYEHHMLIDGNDTRGIDVGLSSRFPIGQMQSHIDDKDAKGVIFSRDCLELVVHHPAGPSINLLINHFKSRGYGSQQSSTEKRRRQAQRVTEILQGYDLQHDLVVVAGDLNDTPTSTPLTVLQQVPHLFDVLALQFNDSADRWTYHFTKNDQIDYLFVSQPLRDALQAAGVERRGIFDVDKFTHGAIQPFDTVTRPANGASDHGAVWADFLL